MKHFFSLLMAVILMFSLCSCGNSAENEIGEEMPNSSVSVPTSATTLQETVNSTKVNTQQTTFATEVTDSTIPTTTTTVEETFTTSSTGFETFPSAPPSATEGESTHISLSFTGDMMLASFKDEDKSGNFKDYANKKEPTYFLEKVQPIFAEDDFTIGNLENVLSDNKLSPIAKDYSPAYWFKAKTSNTDILTSSSVECVSLSNNHTNDYGAQGYKDTLQAVKNAGLYYGDNSNIMYLEKNGCVVAVICTGLWSESTSNIEKRIKEASQQSDFQIVFFHGGKEKLHEPEAWKVRACHKLVDAGADLVIGAHPHVLQPKEVYNGVEIIYSLGNFCYGGHQQPENRTIIYRANIVFDAEKQVVHFSSSMIPCYVYTTRLNNFQPAPIEDADIKQRVLDFMNGKEKSPV